MKSQNNRKLRYNRKELLKIEVYGEDYLGFTTFDQVCRFSETEVFSAFSGASSITRLSDVECAFSIK
jgi:hypothetical protein